MATNAAPGGRAVLRFFVPASAFVVVYALLASYGHEKAVIGGIFALTVALWITELLPLAVTALLSTSLLVVLSDFDEKKAFAAYGDPIVPLFIGSFLLAKAMDLTGLSKRFAYYILNRRWACRSPGRLLLALGFVSCVISLFVSNTATTAMMLPIGLAVLGVLGERRDGSMFAIGMMLMLTWSSSVAVGLPVGTPPNLIGISLIDQATGLRIGFVQWMQFGMPITIATFAFCWLFLRWRYRAPGLESQAASVVANTNLQELGPMKPSERVVLAAFATASLLWALPDVAALVLGTDSKIAAWTKDHLTNAVGAVFAAALLFLLPARDREGNRALTWSEGTRIDWGTILLFGGGIALGQALFASGLAEDLGKLAAQVSGAHSLWAITGLIIVAAIFLSELASNTAAATTLVPVAIALAKGAEVSPVAPALGAAIGASFGFMLPVSTAPNAIVYSSGLVPPREMMKAGLILDLVSAGIIWAVLRAVIPMMGLD